MVRWSRISSILLVAVTLAAILLPGTATARYVVEPVTEEYTGEMHDLEEITFWDLPPRVMLLYFLLTLLPGLPYVGELFYALSILLPLGFRRVRRHNVLDDDFRRDLYRQITIHPGASTRELRKLTGASRGRLRYHLDMLIREGKVAAVDYRNRFRILRETSGIPPSRSASSPASGTRPRGRYWYLLRSPGATRNEIAEDLGLSGPTVSQHMQRFEAEGIVVIDREERTFCYRLSRDSREVLNKHQDRPVSRHPA